MLGILALVPALPLLGFAILFVTAGLLPRRWIEAVGVGSVGISTILALIVMVVFLGSPQPYSRNRLELDRGRQPSRRTSASISMRCRW